MVSIISHEYQVFALVFFAGSLYHNLLPISAISHDLKHFTVLSCTLPLRGKTLFTISDAAALIDLIDRAKQVGYFWMDKVFKGM